MSNADKLLKRVEYYEKMASTQKPEVGDLLNKASLFERLALYSDRQSFLQALAQTDPNKALIERAYRLMQQAGVDDATIAPLGNAVTFNRVDIPAIQRAIQTAVLTKIPPSLSGPQDELRNISRQLKATLTPEPETIELDNVGDHTPQDEHSKSSLPSIDPEDQKAVFQFAIEQGQLVPNPSKQQGDGQLGPETRKALEGVKNYFSKQNPQNSRMTDQEAIQAAKFKGR